MSFLDELSANRSRQIEDRIAKEEAAAADKSSIDTFNKAVGTYLDNYSDWAKKNNGKFAKSSRGDIEKRIRNFVKTSGMNDGELTDKSSEAEIARYGAKFLNNLSGLKEDGSEYTFKDYLDRYGSDEEKTAAGRQLGAISAMEKYRKLQNEGIQRDMSEEDRRLINSAKYSRDSDMKWLNSAKTKYGTWQETNNNDLYDIFENYETYMPAKKEEGNGESTEKASTTTKTTSDGKTTTTSDTVTFTLPRANDPNYRGFGQKIIDLGLATDNGLWGDNGDVKFYTKQLYEQGALDKNGNLKIGVPIKLRRRK